MIRRWLGYKPGLRFRSCGTVELRRLGFAARNSNLCRSAARSQPCSPETSLRPLCSRWPSASPQGSLATSPPTSANRPLNAVGRGRCTGLGTLKTDARALPGQAYPSEYSAQQSVRSGQCSCPKKQTAPAKAGAAWPGAAHPGGVLQKTIPARGIRSSTVALPNAARTMCYQDPHEQEGDEPTPRSDSKGLLVGMGFLGGSFAKVADTSYQSRLVSQPSYNPAFLVSGGTSGYTSRPAVGATGAASRAASRSANPARGTAVASLRAWGSSPP